MSDETMDRREFLRKSGLTVAGLTAATYGGSAILFPEEAEARNDMIIDYTWRRYGRKYLQIGHSPRGVRAEPNDVHIAITCPDSTARFQVKLQQYYFWSWRDVRTGYLRGGNWDSLTFWNPMRFSNRARVMVYKYRGRRSGYVRAWAGWR